MLKRILAMLTVMMFMFSMTAYADVDGNKVDGRAGKGDVIKEAEVQRPSGTVITTGPAISVEIQDGKGSIASTDPAGFVVSQEQRAVSYGGESVPVTHYETAGYTGISYKVKIETIPGYDAEVYKWEPQGRDNGSDPNWSYWQTVEFLDYQGSDTIWLRIRGEERYLVLYEPMEYAFNFDTLANHFGTTPHAWVSPNTVDIYTHGEQVNVNVGVEKGYDVDSWWAYFGVNYDTQLTGIDVNIYRNGDTPPVLKEIKDVVLPTFEADGYIVSVDDDVQKLARFLDYGGQAYQWMDGRSPEVYSTIYLKVKEVREVNVAVEEQNGVGDIAPPTTPAGFMTGPTMMLDELVDLGTKTVTADWRRYSGRVDAGTSIEIPVKYIEGYYADVYKFVPDDDVLTHMNPSLGNWVYYDRLWFSGGYDSFTDTISDDFETYYSVVYEPFNYFVGFWTLDETGLVEGVNPNGFVDQPGVYNEAMPMPPNPDFHAYDTKVDVNVDLQPGYRVDSWWAYFWIFPDINLDEDYGEGMMMYEGDYPMTDLPAPTKILKEIKDDVMPQFHVDGYIESVDGDIKGLPRLENQADDPEMIYAKIVEIPTTRTTTTTTTTVPETETRTRTTTRTGTTTRPTTTEEVTTTTAAPTTTTVVIPDPTIPEAVTEAVIEDMEIPETGGIPMAGFSLIGAGLFGFGLMIKKRN